MKGSSWHAPASDPRPRCAAGPVRRVSRRRLRRHRLRDLASRGRGPEHGFELPALDAFPAELPNVFTAYSPWRGQVALQAQRSLRRLLDIICHRRPQLPEVFELSNGFRPVDWGRYLDVGRLGRFGNSLSRRLLARLGLRGTSADTTIFARLLEFVGQLPPAVQDGLGSLRRLETVRIGGLEWEVATFAGGRVRRRVNEQNLNLCSTTRRCFPMLGGQSCL